MTYELWSKRSGNVLGSYRSEDAALEAARRIADPNPEFLSDVILGVENDDGESSLLAEGAALRRLVDTRRALRV